MINIEHVTAIQKLQSIAMEVAPPIFQKSITGKKMKYTSRSEVFKNASLVRSNLLSRWPRAMRANTGKMPFRTISVYNLSQGVLATASSISSSIDPANFSSAYSVLQDLQYKKTRLHDLFMSNVYPQVGQVTVYFSVRIFIGLNSLLKFRTPSLLQPTTIKRVTLDFMKKRYFRNKVGHSF